MPNQTITFAGEGRTLSAYAAHPEGDGSYPGVGVIHYVKGIIFLHPWAIGLDSQSEAGV